MRLWIPVACAALLGCGPAEPRGERGDDRARHDGAGGESDEGGAVPEDVRTGPSEMLERIKNAGLDPENLPPLESLTMEQKQNAIMPAFARALGVQCRHCHDGANYAAPTVNRAVTKRMYEDFVRSLRLEDGSPLFCDSCHAREPDFLPDDHEAVTRFMRKNYVGPLERIDGGDHGCATCHGDPPRWDFLPTTAG